MKIFVDSADLDEIKQAYEWGVADGVTTNPSLLKKAVEKRKKKGEKLNLKSYINAILKVAKGTPVSLEVTETSAKGMVKQGKALFRMFNPVAKNVYIKIPVNPAFKDADTTHFDGIEAMRELTRAKIPINCTLIFTPEQALLAAKAGAAFVSPFAGRIDDYIRVNNRMEFEKTGYFPAEGWKKGDKTLEDNGVVSGIDLVAQCVELMETHNLPTLVLAASLRNPRQVREAALAGAQIATLPFGVMKDMLKHFKTFEGMDKFTKDIVEEYVALMK